MLKKLIFKAVLVAGIMLGLSSYAGYLMTGQLPFSFLKNLTGNLQSTAREKLSDLKTLERPKNQKTETGEVLNTGNATVYKWRDAEGVLHYSSEPPPQGTQASTMLLDSKVNVLSAVKAPISESQPEKSAAKEVVAEGLSNPYTPEGVKEIMDKTKKTQKQMQERMEQQQKILQDL